MSRPVGKMTIVRRSVRYEGRLEVLTPEPPMSRYRSVDSAYDPADNDYDSDFETSENGNESSSNNHSDYDYESDFESSENESDNSEIELDYGNGIILQTTEKYRSKFDRFTTLNWNVFDTSLNLKQSLLKGKKKFASDIFKVIAQNIYNLDQGRTPCMFAFNVSMRKHIMFKVPVFESYQQVDKSVVEKLYSFSAVIESNGDWNEMPAKFEEGFVTFSCCCVNSFCIQSKPKKLAQVICPRGMILKTGADGKLVVKFPEGCVKKMEDISYKIIRPTITNIKETLPAWNPNLLIAVSDKICLKFTRECLKTPIELSFPFPGSKLKRPGTEPRLIGFKQGQPSLLETIGQQVGDKILYKLKGYDGAALALVQVKNIRYMKHVLTKELEIFYGCRILCNIILFVTRKTHTQINFVANCVMQGEKQSVIEAITNNGARCIFESDALCLHPLQRIRIQVGGKIRAAPGYSKKMFLTFLCESKNNYVNFPVAMKAGGTPYAIIEFSLDNINCKGVVSSVHFEPYGSYKSWYRSTKRFF